MLQFVHMIQHLSCEFLSSIALSYPAGFRVNWHSLLHRIGMFACNNFLRFFCGFGARITHIGISLLVHPTIVNIISILNCKPRILFNVLAVLKRLQVDDIILRSLLVIDSSLIHQHQTSLTNT